MKLFIAVRQSRLQSLLLQRKVLKKLSIQRRTCCWPSLNLINDRTFNELKTPRPRRGNHSWSEWTFAALTNWKSKRQREHKSPLRGNWKSQQKREAARETSVSLPFMTKKKCFFKHSPAGGRAKVFLNNYSASVAGDVCFPSSTTLDPTASSIKRLGLKSLH